MDEQLRQYLIDHLKLDSETSSSYTGGMDDGPLYRDVTTVRLMLDDECLGEVTVG